MRHMMWRDFDEFGVPTPCPPHWRSQTTEQWLAVALENQRRGIDTGIVGAAVPGEILACPSAPEIQGIHMLLLDCHDVTRIDRLRRRNGKEATQDMLNWASWHRMHALDPQWRPDYIRSPKAWPELKWDRWADWKRGDERWKIEVLDTTNLTIDQVVGGLAEWVAAVMENTK